MTLLTQRDFETKAGQEKIIKVIHGLEQRVHALSQRLHECMQKEHNLERDLSGYETDHL